MDLGTLQKWRFVIPSILMAVVLFPLLYGVASMAPVKFPGGLLGEAIKCSLLLIFVPLGVLYDSMQFRGLLNGVSCERINQFVEDQLRITLQPVLTGSELARAPVGDRRWMRLLYRQVDADPTLTELAKRIRDNGIRWSTVPDVGVIFILGGVATGLYGSFVSEHFLVWYALSLILIGFVGAKLVSTMERRHIELCRDQQDHIRGFLVPKLRADFLQVFGP